MASRNRGGYVPYSYAEYADMLMEYGRADTVSTAAAESYALRYPNRPNHPNANTIQDVYNRIRETGCVHRRRREIPAGHHDDEDVALETAVLQRIAEDPYISTRALGLEFGVPHTRIWRIINAAGNYPYKLASTPEIRPADPAQRSEFCEWYLQNQGTIARQILYTDESLFTRDGIFNRRNEHYWSTENPHATRITSSQNRFTVHVWVRVLNNTILGPVEFPTPLTSQLYLNFLRDQLPQLIEEALMEVPLVDRMPLPNGQCPRLYYQHDGSGPHYGTINCP